jgi:hypothetical protein
MNSKREFLIGIRDDVFTHRASRLTSYKKIVGVSLRAVVSANTLRLELGTNLPDTFLTKGRDCLTVGFVNQTGK